MPALIPERPAGAGLGVVVWMRHGLSADAVARPGAHARPDAALHPDGYEAIAATAAAMADLGVTVVLTSPLRRARATADRVAAALGNRHVIPLDELVEWRAPTCVLGLAPADYPPDYLGWKQVRAGQPDACLPGGESLSAFAARTGHAASRVTTFADAMGATVLVVSHKLVIGAVAARAAGITEPGAVFDAAGAFDLPPAGWWRRIGSPAAGGVLRPARMMMIGWGEPALLPHCARS